MPGLAGVLGPVRGRGDENGRRAIPIPEAKEDSAVSKRDEHPYRLSELCPQCEAVSYQSKGSARAARKQLHPDRHLAIYCCPADENLFHLGRLPIPVIRGLISRDDLMPH